MGKMRGVVAVAGLAPGKYLALALAHTYCFHFFIFLFFQDIERSLAR